MDRRRFLLTSLVSAFASPHATGAQQAAKIARIGWLAGNRAASPHLPEAFRQGLRDLGYVESGIFVACFTAKTAGVVHVTMTSTLRPMSSVMSGRFAAGSAAMRYSRTIFWPGM